MTTSTTKTATTREHHQHDYKGLTIPPGYCCICDGSPCADTPQPPAPDAGLRDEHAHCLHLKTGEDPGNGKRYCCSCDFDESAPSQPSRAAGGEREEHTPTPWYLYSASYGTTIVGADSSEILPPMQLPDGELYMEDLRYIVACVNSHKSLVAALEHLRTWLVAPATDVETIREMRQMIDAALTQARDGE